ncbi:hypothetical protein HanPSC8_Chr06g0235901 [Helianthus annuus]|nr:hypothetical protein HanPSC8_Chr06g0235901 [Helianthus annuus]
MASPVPAKSQPLHNFSLPHLKWKNHRSGRGRVAGDTSSSSPPHRSPSTATSHHHIHPHPPYLQQSSPYVSRRPSPLHKQSPMRDSESESEQNGVVPIGKPSGKTVYEKSTKSSKLTKVIKPIDVSKGKRSSNKICIRLRKNNGNVKHDDAVITANRSSTPVEADTGTGMFMETEAETAVMPSSAAEEEESAPKIWNLRPRRAPMNHKQFTGSPKIGSSPLPENRYLHGSSSFKEALDSKYIDHNILSTSKKIKFSISLSRDEIEEDIFSLTGLKPSRRPKKRPRTVQKQLDTLFPGLWLGSITADSYKVSEGTPKV